MQALAKEERNLKNPLPATVDFAAARTRTTRETDTPRKGHHAGRPKAQRRDDPESARQRSWTSPPPTLRATPNRAEAKVFPGTVNNHLDDPVHCGRYYIY